jgi:hypothetical protein
VVVLLYKCNYCDPTITKEMRKKGMNPFKSIDTEKDAFVKDEKSKYYHIECYKKHLAQRKKMNEEEIENKLRERLEVTQKEIKEAEAKDRFLRWIMEFYDGSLPSYFLKKLQLVREGKYEGLNEPIDYLTLLDIYQKMEKFLRKNALKKNFQNVTQQMNYDLAVVVGNYGDYKRYIEKQKKNEITINDIDKQIEVTNKVISKTDNGQQEEKEFDITDVIDELLL